MAASRAIAAHQTPAWLRAEADVHVAALAGEFAGPAVSPPADAPVHPAFGPHVGRIGDVPSLEAAQAALEAAPAHPSRGAPRPRRSRRGYPGHERGSRQRRNIAMATGIVSWFNSDKG